jgi:hypothetical protein
MFRMLDLLFKLCVIELGFGFVSLHEYKETWI